MLENLPRPCANSSTSKTGMKGLYRASGTRRSWLVEYSVDVNVRETQQQRYTENNVILHILQTHHLSREGTRSSSDLIAGLRYCITFLNRRQYRHKALRMLELRLDYVKCLVVHCRCIRAGTKKDTRSTTSPLLVIFADEHTTEPPISSAPPEPPTHPTPTPLALCNTISPRYVVQSPLCGLGRVG